MDRYFEIAQKIKLHHASPFDGAALSRMLRDYIWTEPDVCGEFADVIDCSVIETTDPDTIASAVGDEVAEVIGQTVFCNRIGDNGNNDVGYEITHINGRRCVVDIGVMRCMDGVWYVVVDRAEDHNIPVDSADDLRCLILSEAMKEIVKSATTWMSPEELLTEAIRKIEK